MTRSYIGHEKLVEIKGSAYDSRSMTLFTDSIVHDLIVTRHVILPLLS